MEMGSGRRHVAFWGHVFISGRVAIFGSGVCFGSGGYFRVVYSGRVSFGRVFILGETAPDACDAQLRAGLLAAWQVEQQQRARVDLG